MTREERTPSDGAAQQRAGLKAQLSRRKFLLGAAGGAAALGLAGLAGYEWPHAGPSLKEQIEDAIGVQRFLSRPDLLPPTVGITSRQLAPTSVSEESPRFIFLSPRFLTPQPSQQGLMILDRLGRLVWFHPITEASPFDFNAQLDGTAPRLSWWQGDIVNAYGVGIGELADASYRPAGTVRAGNGLRIDLHELNLTSRGTALVTAYAQERKNLTAFGGARDAIILSGHAQEIDLSTGRVLFDWSSLDHISPAESYQSAPSDADVVYDYFHINSIGETPDGNLLIGARNTWAIYKVDRSTGAVLWRLGGRRSDFDMGVGTRFYWQHDARMPADDVVTVFDDGSAPPEESHARGLLLHVDEATRHCELTQAYIHPTGFLAANQGSMQLLGDGRVFIGWGNQPFFSEFASDGVLLLDGELPLGVRSYRAYTADWVGTPAEPPAAVTRPNPGGGVIIYVSWNGATEVATWALWAGTRHDQIHAIGSQPWSGFETAIATSNLGPYYAAVALDSSGKELGRTRVLT